MKKKLTLNKKTISNLNDDANLNRDDLNEVQGGAIPEYSNDIYCTDPLTGMRFTENFCPTNSFYPYCF